MIQPTYVTLHQAKLLKQMGFNIPCGYKWGLTEHAESSNDIVIEGAVYSLYCYRDFGIYAIQIKNWNDELVYVGGKWVPLDALSAPEQWVVVEWLRIVHGIQVFLDYTFYDGFHYGCKYVKSNGDYGDIWKEGVEDDIDGVSTPQEAYSTAFDYILNNLI